MKIHTLDNNDDARRPNLERSDSEGSDNEGARQPNEYFVGSGQQVIDPRQNIGGFNARLNSVPGSSRGPSNVQRVNIEMFDDGFTVDDGPLRLYDDPANVAFMDALKSRETPPEFLKKFGGRPIDVHCFKKPGKYVFKPFSGVGHRLGAVAPQVVNVEGEAEAAELITDTSSLMTENMRRRAQEAINLDKDGNVVRIQFRFPKGHRITGEFNPSMTVINHLREFVVTADPAFAFNLFSFYAGFPPSKIEDEGLTIEQAGLSNSVVNIRMA